MKLVFATRNPGKVLELSALVAPLDFEVVSLDEVGFAGSVVEDEPMFAGNASKKARAIARATGLPTLADDSGLEVDALGGEPGVHSARYAGLDANDEANNRKLLNALKDVPDDRRTARFRCALAYVDPRAEQGFDGESMPRSPDSALITEGACEGRILTTPRGSGGFGYDPLFFVERVGRTFAELSVAEKNSLSHRAQAFRAMAQALATRRRII